MKPFFRGAAAAWAMAGVLALVVLAYAQLISVAPDAVVGTQANVSCATTATLAITKNAKRRSWIVATPSGNTENIFIGFNTSVTIGNGIPLGAGVNMSDDKYIGDVYCIVTTSAQSLRVAEVTR